MPVLERDPWRLQYFEGSPCPEHVKIPTDDPDCWMLYPSDRWVYDKLRIAWTQDLACGPHGVPPNTYPVFSKPIINLRGMGTGSRKIASAEEMERFSEPGHMWMPLLAGEHVSTDCAVLGGRIAWLRHATGSPWTDGMFRHWRVHAGTMPVLARQLEVWVAHHMSGYSGMMNFETIGGTIIEAHLRFADQWCDLYGRGWVEALIELYSSANWQYADVNRVDGYSVPLFARHGHDYRHPPPALQEEVRKMPSVSSLQITFHQGKPQASHAMPPGGFRLAVINATDLEAAHAARRRLASAWSADLVLDQTQTEQELS